MLYFLALRSHSVKLSGSSSKIFSVLFGVPQGSILGPLLFILYTSNIVNIASQHGLVVHLYADDTQLYIKLCYKNLDNIKVKMAACIHHIQSWCASMRLKLNATKTELIWFDRRSRLVDNSTTHLNLDPQCSIPPFDVVCDLGVLMDCKLNMTQHVSSTARTCFFHLRRIRQVRRCLDETCRRILVFKNCQALVISRLDYCNSVLSGLPSSTLQPLSSVLHTAARLIKDLSPRDHNTPTLKQLHWLPIHARIAFKISLLMYHIHSGTSSSYMSSMVTPCPASRSRGLRSSTRGDFAVIRTNLKFCNRAFLVAGPREWNSLPVSVRQCTPVAQFKSKLKTHLFSLYYD